jgi:hypothetical protein
MRETVIADAPDLAAIALTPIIPDPVLISVCAVGLEKGMRSSILHGLFCNLKMLQYHEVSFEGINATS